MRGERVCIIPHLSASGSGVATKPEAEMNARAVGTMLVTVLALSHPARATEVAPEPLAPDTQKALDAAVAKELKAYGGKESIPGAVIDVWIPGKAPYLKAIGLAELSPPRAMALDDKFRVGSNTKTFVVTVLLQLVDEGKLGLDDPISKFDLGVNVPNGENITIREL